MRERLFAINYVGQAHGNAREAAELAGFEREDGGGIVKRARVQSMIAALRMAELSNAIACKERLVGLTVGIAVDPDVSTKDQLRALDMLAKMQGYYLDEKAVEGDGPLDAMVKAMLDKRKRKSKRAKK